MNTRWWWSPGLGENGLCDLDQRSTTCHWVEKQKWVTKYVWSCRDLQAFHQDLHWFIHHWHPMVSTTFAELTPPARGARLLFNGHPSQAFLKQALTYRGAVVWKGKSCPNSGTGLDSGRPHPSTEVSQLISCRYILPHSVDLKKFTTITWKSEKLVFL